MDLSLGFVTWICLNLSWLLAVTGVMHEADDAYSIRSTWSCYWLDQFLTLALNILILSIFYISVDLPTNYFAHFSGCWASFSCGCHYPRMLCHVFWSQVEYKIIRFIYLINTKCLKLVLVSNMFYPLHQFSTPFNRCKTHHLCVNHYRSNMMYFFAYCFWLLQLVGLKQNVKWTLCVATWVWMSPLVSIYLFTCKYRYDISHFVLSKLFLVK